MGMGRQTDGNCIYRSYSSLCLCHRVERRRTEWDNVDKTHTLTVSADIRPTAAIISNSVSRRIATLFFFLTVSVCKYAMAVFTILLCTAPLRGVCPAPSLSPSANNAFLRFFSDLEEDPGGMP